MSRGNQACDLVDVFVIGGGPAGATAARLLASWGWSVVVAHRTSSQPSLAESLPPSTRKLLAFLGNLDGVDAAGFHPNHGNIAHWAGELRTTNTDAPGFHVSRGAFDRVLREHAKAAGARIFDGGVRRVDVADPVRLHGVTTDGRAEMCHARYVLDCSGRAGVVARHGLRQQEAHYRTLAIAAEWKCDRWPEGEHAHTIVESYADGWAWSVPLSATRRQCTVMIDVARSKGLALRAVYAREIAKALEIDRRLAPARQTTAPWACDASLYHSVRPADGPALLVGDAASFIEPLSSAGVKKALASAWRAAVVTNTWLARPEMADAASSFYTRREREIDAECGRRSALFFAEASAVHATPFWCARAASAIDQEITAPFADHDLGRDPGVAAAFDNLRRATLVRLRPAPALRFAAAAEIDGREIVMREALVVPGLETPLRFAAGVNLPALVRLAAGCDEMSSIISAYESEVGHAPVHGLLTGLSFLVARRALIHEDSRS